MREKRMLPSTPCAAKRRPPLGCHLTRGRRHARWRALWLLGLSLAVNAYAGNAPLDEPAGAPPTRPGFVRMEQLSLPLSGLQFVDARSSTDFERGHIPGALHLEWSSFQDGWFREGRLPADLTALAKSLADRGIDARRTVVVCGTAHRGFGEEGRIAWMLRYLGHPNVQILDGGCDTWRRAGKTWTQERSRSTSGYFPLRIASALRATRTDVERALRTSRVQLLDARSWEEYLGATPYFEARGGHIPGAHHFHFLDAMDNNGFVHAQNRLLQMLAERQIDPQRPVIVYCTGGVRSAWLTWMFLSLGIDARNYDASLWEWASDSKLPLERSARDDLTVPTK